MIRTDGRPTIANAPRGYLDAILAEDAERRQAEAPAGPRPLRGRRGKREALAMFWKEIRVGRKDRPKSRGPVPLTFVARWTSGGEAEVALTEDAA